MDIFKKVVDDNTNYVKEWKKQGKKVVGYFCTLTPEEIIYAADMLPVRITGSYSEVSKADNFVQRNICPYARSCFELGLTGHYDDLDALVVPHSCDIITKMMDLWQETNGDKPVYFINAPHLQNPKNLKYGIAELREFLKNMEMFSGKEITRERLLESIKVYNANREVLRNAYYLRKLNPTTPSGVHMINMILSSMKMPKEIHTSLVREYLRTARLDEEGPPDNKLPRLLITGSVIDDDYFISLVEEAGANVVADDLCVGSRYIWNLVSEKEEDLLEALARRYFLEKTGCARTYPIIHRYNTLINMVKEFRVDGVVFYLLKYCDAHQTDYPVLQRKLEELNIPVMDIESDYTISGIEQTKTRIEAFIEMLGGINVG